LSSTLLPGTLAAPDPRTVVWSSPSEARCHERGRTCPGQVVLVVGAEPHGFTLAVSAHGTAGWMFLLPREAL